MMQLVHCDNCNGTTIGLGSVSVNVELNKSHHCDKCCNVKTEITHYFFCCEGCFLTYIQKVVQDKASFKFNRHTDAVQEIYMGDPPPAIG